MASKLKAMASILKTHNMQTSKKLVCFTLPKQIGIAKLEPLQKCQTREDVFLLLSH